MSQQINLYEPRLRPRHDLATGRNLGICTLLVLVLMTGLAVWAEREAAVKTQVAAGLQKQVAAEQEKLVALTKSLSMLQVSPALVAELDGAKAMLASRQEVLTVLDSGKLGNAKGFSTVMSGFARQTQADLWLTGFLVSAGGEEVEIRGRVLDPAKLPAYVQKLSSEPAFQGRRFAALEMRGVDPDEQKTDSAVAVNANRQNGKDAEKQAEKQAAATRLPRFVEFVLRSENAAVVEGATRGGARP